MNDIKAVELLAYSPEDAAKASSFGRTVIFEAIRNGELVARKRGGRTVITREDLQSWIRAMPKIQRVA